MKRLLWLGAGLAIGALVVRAVSKRARSFTPRGIAAAALDSGRNVVDSVRDFVDDVREGMREREQELHAAFFDAAPLTDDDFNVGSTAVGGAEPEPSEQHHPEGRR